MSLVAVNWNPTRQQLRGFGVICLVAFGIVGGIVFFRHKFLWIGMEPQTATTVAAVLLAFGAGCVVLGWIAPNTLRPLYVGLTAITLPIGFVVSHVIMAVIFYGILTPVGLVFRLMGRDSLHRRFDRQASSYWSRRELVTDVRRYYRQF